MSKRRKRPQKRSRKEPKDNLHYVSSLILSVFIMMAAYQYTGKELPTSIKVEKSSILPTGHASVYRCALYSGYEDHYCDPSTYNKRYCDRYTKWVDNNCLTICGNNVLEDGEQCDGNAFGIVNSCTDYSHFDGGNLRCGLDCTLDTSGCTTF